MITENISPSGTISLNDDLWHIVMSDNSGEVNFKYVFDLYNSQSEQLVRCKIYPNVNNGKGYFNATNVVRNEIMIDYFMPPTTASFITQELSDDNWKIEYTYEIGEDYNLGFSGITDIGLASGSVTAYNYLPSLFKRRQQDLSKYNTTYSLISNRPRIVNAMTDENIFIGLNKTGNINVDLRVYLFATNTLVDTYPLSANVAALPILNIGATSLMNSFPLDIESNLSPSNYYILDFGNEEIRVNLLCNNPLHEPVLLHFINAYGFLDTARFGCANKLNMSVNRKSYLKPEYTFGSTSVDYYTNNVYKESKINYYQDIQWNYKLMMDYPTDEEYEWLSELIYSPLIYMEKDGKFYPVTIKNTNYEYVKRISSKLRTLEVEIELNQNRNGFSR